MNGVSSSYLMEIVVIDSSGAYGLRKFRYFSDVRVLIYFTLCTFHFLFDLTVFRC